MATRHGPGSVVRHMHVPIVHGPVSLRGRGNARDQAHELRQERTKPSGSRASSIHPQAQTRHPFIDAVPRSRRTTRTSTLGNFTRQWRWRTLVVVLTSLAAIASMTSMTSRSSRSSRSTMTSLASKLRRSSGTSRGTSPAATFATTSQAAVPPSPMTVVVPSLDDESFVLKATWRDVLEHMRTRLSYEDPDLRFDVVDLSSSHVDVGQLAASKVVYALNVRNEDQVHALLDAVSPSASFVALNSSKLLESRNALQSASAPSGSGLFSFVAQFFGSVFGRSQAASETVLKTIKELYHRQSADDFLYSFLVYFNAVTKPVQSIVNSTKRSDAGLKEVMCMVKNCGKEIIDCVTEDTCSKGLACLNTCAFNDQVCSYLCIASYESAAFEQFSLCILQRHNCLGLSADIPANPRAQPMKTFRGAPMTHELAESLFNGWLDQSQETFSWRVFAGMNAAFDRFPCQYQLFFPGTARNTFWYRPVFKVETLEGETVWRERLYRVRRQPKAYRDDGLPVFRLSVLDNGVTSLEDWTVLSCDERQDGGTPEWCVFSYSGAASKAGMSYYGAILASRTGEWPTDQHSLEMIESSLDRSGIKMWELFTVDNSQCVDFDPSVTALPRVWAV